MALGEILVFDWDKAARIIRQTRAKRASARLRGADDDWSGGTIFVCGRPNYDAYTYLASRTAIPELVVDGEVYECWRPAWKTPGWGARTKWPESALEILRQARPGARPGTRATRSCTDQSGAPLRAVAGGGR